MAFGKTFLTRKEANEHLKKIQGNFPKPDNKVRKLSKKSFPRAKKRFHVGSHMDWLNWA